MEWCGICKVLRIIPGTYQVLSCTQGLTGRNPTLIKLLCIFAFFSPLRKVKELLELQVLRQKAFFRVADATWDNMTLLIQKALTQTSIPKWSQFTQVSEREKWTAKTMRSTFWTKQGNDSWPHRRYDCEEILHPCLYKTKQEMFANGINKGAFWLHNVSLCPSLRLFWNQCLL